MPAILPPVSGLSQLAITVQNRNERLPRYPDLVELIFAIREAEKGGFCARALGHAIFSEAETWEELRSNLLEAVSVHFEDTARRPRLVQMHYVKDELIPMEAA